VVCVVGSVGGLAKKSRKRRCDSGTYRIPDSSGGSAKQGRFGRYLTEPAKKGRVEKRGATSEAAATCEEEFWFTTGYFLLHSASEKEKNEKTNVTNE